PAVGAADAAEGALRADGQFVDGAFRAGPVRDGVCAVLEVVRVDVVADGDVLRRVADDVPVLVHRLPGVDGADGDLVPHGHRAAVLDDHADVVGGAQDVETFHFDDLDPISGRRGRCRPRRDAARRTGTPSRYRPAWSWRGRRARRRTQGRSGGTRRS